MTAHTASTTSAMPRMVSAGAESGAKMLVVTEESAASASVGVQSATGASLNPSTGTE
jgi:hypothetical protein